MLRFTDEEKKLQSELSWHATRLKELAFEIEIGKYKSVEINHKNLTHEIRDGGLDGRPSDIRLQEYGFELTIRVLYK